MVESESWDIIITVEVVTLGEVNTEEMTDIILHQIKPTCRLCLEEKTIWGKDLWNFMEEG